MKKWIKAFRGHDANFWNGSLLRLSRYKSFLIFGFEISHEILESNSEEKNGRVSKNSLSLLHLIPVWTVRTFP